MTQSGRSQFEQKLGPRKAMSNKDIARGLSLMVLFSSLFTLKFNLSFVMNWAAYSNLAGQIQAATTLSYWITVVGAILLLMDKRSGYW
jgi:hypothetical protein